MSLLHLLLSLLQIVHQLELVKPLAEQMLLQPVLVMHLLLMIVLRH